MNAEMLSGRWLGYEVWTHGLGTHVGRVEAVRARGVRLHRMPQHDGRHGYLPAEAIDAVDHHAGTMSLRIGISPASILDAPPPPNEAPERWHTSPEWWADLLGHYGLYTASGRSSQTLLYAGAR